jgi:hypothetical protein
LFFLQQQSILRELCDPRRLGGEQRLLSRRASVTP